MRQRTAIAKKQSSLLSTYPQDEVPVQILNFHYIYCTKTVTLLLAQPLHINLHGDAIIEDYG